jgi:hypothetical protein
VGVQLCAGVRRACPKYFILTVDPAVDVSSLDERDDLSFRIFDGPSKCRAHALELDRRERLEVQHDRASTDKRSEIHDVWAEQGIEQVTSLDAREEARHRIGEKMRIQCTYGKPFQELEHSTEVACHPSIQKLFHPLSLAR